MDDELCIACGHPVDEHESDEGPCDVEGCRCRVCIAPSDGFEPEDEVQPLDFDHSEPKRRRRAS